MSVVLVGCFVVIIESQNKCFVLIGDQRRFVVEADLLGSTESIGSGSSVPKDDFPFLELVVENLAVVGLDSTPARTAGVERCHVTGTVGFLEQDSLQGLVFQVGVVLVDFPVRTESF